MHILLIRHGQSAGNAAGRIQGWNDEPLTAIGRAQALALAQRVETRYQVQAIYASPLLRARETAEIIAEQLGLPAILDERLKERDIGALTGLSFDEVEERYPEIVRAWRQNPLHIPIPGAEDHVAFQRRVMSGVGDIVCRHEEDDMIAIVAHGGTLRACIAGLLALDSRKRQPWKFDNASLSVIIQDGARPRVTLLNDTCHLDHLRSQGTSSGQTESAAFSSDCV